MTNREIAEILGEISEYLAMEDVPFKPRAYEKAGEVVAEFSRPLCDVYKTGGIKALQKISGVGVSIAEKIEEAIRTGTVEYLEELRRKTPVKLHELRMVEGLGPKHIKRLYDEIHVTDLQSLERAAKSHKIQKLSRFGEKSEENILQGIEFIKKSGGRFVLGFMLPVVREIADRLRGVRGVSAVAIAGSARRMKETIGDADLLAVSKTPNVCMDYFTTMSEVAHVIAKGDTKSSVKLNTGLHIDLRVVEAASYGAALNYFTGSKDHNIALREIAIQKGYKLNEYGLYRGKKAVSGKTEEDIYRALGLRYIEPELREMHGELEASRGNKLPNLIRYNDLKGDLQTQTIWTDGKNSIEEMAHAAMKSGLEYIAITDHTKRLAMTGGLDEKKLQRQMKEIDAVNAKLKKTKKDFVILKGTECDILKDGSLDLPDRVLKDLDIVGVSIHSYFNLPREEQTQRIIRAMENSHVDILFHPTGRVINKRDPYDIDIDAVIACAKRTGTILEIDAFPDRLDLRDEYIRKCVNQGVLMSIDSDAHTANQFAYLEYGIGTARRGWATRSDIINAYPLEKMRKFLKS